MASKSINDGDLAGKLDKLVDILGPLVKAAVTPELQENEPQVIISDELKCLLDVKAQLVKQLPNPVMLKIVGTRGTTLVNQTVESLNTVDEQIKGYKSFGSRIKVK